MKKLVVISRIKNEILNIREFLAKLSEIADEIIVLDNGSSDGTFEVYKEFHKVISIIETSGFDEGRDKILLLEEAKKRNPDWIIYTDADEIFEKNFTRKIVEKYMNSKYNKITFRLCHFWLNKKDCRVGKKYFLYSLHPIRIMWRNVPEAYFRPMKIHNGDIRGIKGKTFISPYRLKHFGYVNKEKIKEKINNYNKIDKSGDRAYDHLNPSKKNFTIKFLEFENKYVNYFYIMFYKYVCNLLWIVLRISIRIINIFKILTFK